MNHLLIFFIFMPGIVSGSLNINNEIYISTASELPFSETGLTPDIKWQEHSATTAWIDIIGFRNMTHKNGINYTDDAVNETITQYGIGSSLECFNGVTCNVKSLSGTVYITKTDNIITARLHTVQVWTETYCNDGYCSKDEESEEANFYDHAFAPQQFNLSNNMIEIQRIIYNFSEFNRTYLEVDFDKGQYDRYTYLTASGNLTHIYRTWKLEKTSKGIYYANETLINIIQSNNISHARDTIEIQNETIYTVTANGFYGSIYKTNETRIIRELDSSNQFSPYIIGVFLVFFVLIKAGKIMITRRF